MRPAVSRAGSEREQVEGIADRPRESGFLVGEEDADGARDRCGRDGRDVVVESDRPHATTVHALHRTTGWIDCFRPGRRLLLRSGEVSDSMPMSEGLLAGSALQRSSDRSSRWPRIRSLVCLGSRSSSTCQCSKILSTTDDTHSRVFAGSPPALATNLSRFGSVTSLHDKLPCNGSASSSPGRKATVGTRSYVGLRPRGDRRGR